MRMEKQQYCTTRKQEAELAVLGINPDTADLYRIPMVGGYRITSEWSKNAVPCWSLAALSNLLPLTLKDEDGIVYDRCIFGEEVTYFCIDYDLHLESFDGGTLFENIIECVNWLKHNSDKYESGGK